MSTATGASTTVANGAVITVKAGALALKPDFHVVVGGEFRMQMAPFITSPPSVTPNPLIGTTAQVAVAATYRDGEPALTYTWSKVSGPGTVGFSPNGTNAAKNGTVTFSASGNYVLACAIAATGTSVTWEVAVTVHDDLRVVALDGEAREPGTDTGIFVVSRVGSIAAPLTVNLAVSGTASSGSDFTALPTSLTLPAGAVSATVVVTALDDTLLEGAETVVLTAGASGSSFAAATVTIAQDETVSIAASGTDAAEPSTTTTFTVTRTGTNTSGSLVVPYTVSGTATPGASGVGAADYATLSGSATIAATQTTATITVTPFSDALLEGLETVTVVLDESASYTIGAGAATVGIIDDDTPVVTLAISDATSAEPDANGAFTVTRTGATTDPLVVPIVISGTASNGVDYTAISGSVTIAAASATAVITITPLADGLAEGDETVSIGLGASTAYNIGTVAPLALTIVDRAVSIAVTDGDSSEIGLGVGTFTVTRTGDLTAALTVTYAISGTAINGTDLQTVSGSLNIAASSATGTITVTPIADQALEGDETVTISLNASTTAGISGTGSASIAIVDAPQVRVLASDAQASETGNATGTFTIIRTGDRSLSLSVPFVISGAAVNGTDFTNGTASTPISGSVTIAALSDRATVVVHPVSDDDLESFESVILTLSTDSQYVLGEAIATVSIADFSVSITSADPVATETAGNAASFTIHRTGGNDDALDVLIALSGASAADLTSPDFSVMAPKATIPAGANSVTVSVVPADDSGVEGTEQAIVGLVANANYARDVESVDIAIIDSDIPIVTLAAIGTAVEGGATGIFRATRTGSTGAALTVTYLTVASNADLGDDYSFDVSEFTFDATEATADVVVTAANDTDVEGEEIVVIALSGGASSPLYNIGSPEVGMIITDDETPVVTLALTDGTAAETGPATASFTLTRTGTAAHPLADPFPVEVALTGTAINGVDYSSVALPVVFAATQSTAVVTITPINDGAVEGDETVSIALMRGGEYNLGTTGSFSATISDNDLPSVTVIATDAAALEGGDAGAFAIYRTGPLTAALDVSVTLGGTAASGDYTAIGSTLTIPAGTSELSVALTPINDGTAEGTETVVLTIASDADYAIGSPSSATVSLVDDDTPTVSIATSDGLATETEVSATADPGAIVITRTGSTAAALAVTVTVAGSATVGTDCTLTGINSGTVTIPMGQSSATVAVDVLADGSTAEGTETLSLTVVPTATYNVTLPTTAIVSITDADLQQVSIALGDGAAEENAAVDDPGTFVITRTATSGSLTVAYTVTGTATRGDGTGTADYSAISDSVFFSNGDGSETITISPRNDATTEGSESVIVTLIANPGVYNPGSATSATLVISDDDVPTVSIAAGDATASETSSGTPDTATVVFTRSPPTGPALTVSYTVGGTADANDRQSFTGSVVIPLDTETVTLTVTPLDDEFSEGTETVAVTLARALTYNAGPADVASVTIADNDLPTVTVAASDHQALEASTTDHGAFTVIRNGSTAAALVVQLTVGGTAATPADFASIASSVTIPVGSASATVAVTTTANDAVSEGIETATLAVATDAAYIVGSSLPASVDIVDDDQPVVTIAATDAMASEEGVGHGEFTLARTTTAGALTVTLALSGSATSGGDLQSIATAVVFADGSATALVDLEPIDDAAIEGEESLSLTLVAGAAYQLGAVTTATVNIADNDLPVPDIAYFKGSATSIDAYGTVPGGYGITDIIATAVSGATVSGSLERDLLLVEATQTGGATEAVFTLAYEAGAITGPAVKVTIPFLVGTSGGVPGDLPPGEPSAVTPEIAAGSLTGDQSGNDMPGEDGTVFFTSNQSITVAVSGSTNLGEIQDITLIASDGASEILAGTGAASLSGNITLDTATEGRIELTAIVTAVHGGLTATTISTPVVLFVDRTAPTISHLLAAADRRVAGQAEALRHSLAGDRDLVVLNGVSASDSKALRISEGMNVFPRDTFAWEAEVSDLTGVSRVEARVAAVAAGQGQVTLIAPGLEPATGERSDVLTLGGLSGLDNSVTYDADLSVLDFRGAYTYRLAFQDRCGNAYDADQFRLWVDTQPPVARGGVHTTVLSHARTFWADAEVADAWQMEYPDPQMQMLRAYRTASALPETIEEAGGASPWLFPYVVDVPTEGTSAEVVVTLRDFAGNLASVTTSYARHPVGTDAPDTMATVTAERPFHWDNGDGDQAFWNFTTGGSSPDQLLPAARQEGLYSAEVSVHPRIMLTPYTFTSEGRAYSVNPVDPGPPTNDRRCQPAIINIPPSFRALTGDDYQQPLRLKDQGVVQTMNAGTNQIHTGSITLGLLPGRIPSDLITWLNQPEFGVTLFTGTNQMPDVEPGLTRIYFQSILIEKEGFSPYPEIKRMTYDASAHRWLNAIKLSPDVVATGRRVTLRIEAGFVDKDFKIRDFQPTGDYVRFGTGSGFTDITQPAAEWSATADPEARMGKIAIVSQRMVGEGVNASVRQCLELVVEIGKGVPVELLSVDVKCGAVKEYGDALSQANKGANESHRMKNALAIIEVQLQEQERRTDGTVDEDKWVNNFTIEQTKPIVRILSPIADSVVSSTPDYMGNRQIAISGVIHDLAGRLTGTTAALSINDQPIELTGSGGDYTFSGSVHVGIDGLILAICTDAYGNQGADGMIISRIDAVPPNATRPINPPESQDVLEDPNGYIFSQSNYTLTETNTGYNLKSKNILTSSEEIISLTYYGSLPILDEEGDLTALVFRSADAEWSIEIYDQTKGTSAALATKAVSILTAGQREQRTLIEATPGSGIFLSQAAEVSWTTATSLSLATIDVIDAVIYKPFSTKLTVQLTETSAGSNTFEGTGGVSVSISAANGFESPVAIVTAPGLGLSNSPTITASIDGGAVNYQSGPLVRQTATLTPSGFISEGSYSEWYKALPIADVLPEPRAKRIAVRIPGATAATKTVTISTDSGTSHVVVLGKIGHQYISPPLLYEVGAHGTHVLGGFPVKFEGEADGNGDPPIAMEEDVGGDVVVDITSDGEKIRNIVLRRIPNTSDEPDSEVVTESRDLENGTRVRIHPAGVFGGGEDRSDETKYFIRLDQGQWKYLNLEAEAAIIDEEERLDALQALEGDEAEELRVATSEIRGGSAGGWYWMGPRDLAGMANFSKGFAEGCGQQLNELINPWEILKGLMELAHFVATTDFGQVDGGAAFKKVIFGYFETCQDAARRGDMLGAGRAAGEGILFFASIPVGVEVLPLAFAKLRKVTATLKITCPLLTSSNGVARSTATFTELLVKFESRFTYRKINPATNRFEGPVVIYVTKELMLARVGKPANRAVKFPGVDDSRFVRSPLTNKSELERGHLGGKQFGCDGDAHNLVPLYWRVNRIHMKQYEMQVANLVRKHGVKTTVQVEAIFGAHPSIPEFIHFKAFLDTKVYIDEFIPNIP